ncbi:MAG: hypothetical protein MH472_07320, partial [Bacteroidia bacterium]|nr:hypothetical protein [Bacteroidia bacterium]
MKKLLIFILCCVVGNVKAQSFCEVDSVYTMFDRETAYRIIETEGNSFITVSIGGLNGSTQVNVPLVTLTKLNSCGHEFWRKIIDFGYNNYAEIGELWTDNSNGDVRFTALINGTGSLLKNNGLRMYKVNSQGEVIQNIKIGDTLFQYFRIKSLKINENKYILASNVLLPQNQNSVCYLIDSSGFILANIITPNQSSILEVDQKDDGTILLIFNQQANFLILNIDSLGGKISEWQIPKLDNSWSLQSFGTNFSGTEFLYSATRENKMALARLTLLGAKIKDTVFENESFGPFHLPYERNNINYLSDRYFIISKSKVVLMDTDFNVIKIDSSSKNNSRIYHSILSSDSSLVSVGNGNFRNVGSGNSV